MMEVKVIARVRSMVDRVARERDILLQHRWLRPLAPHLSHPTLWHINRRSLTRAVPLGFIIAFLFPIGQAVGAVAAALYLRAYVPATVAITFITNPFSLPFIYYLAYRVGSLFVRAPPLKLSLDPSQMSFSLLGTLLLGFTSLALGSAALGYAATALCYRRMLTRRWRRRGHALPQSR